MNKNIRAAVLLTATAFPVAAGAQVCVDRKAQEPCAREVKRQQRDLYGAPPLDQLVARHIRVIRAFFRDGYGGDAGMVSFVREPGMEPHLETRAFSRPFDPTSQVLTQSGVVPLSTWNDLVDEGRFFERDLVPVKPDSPIVCLHPWSVRVETVDARGNVRRKSADACTDTLAVGYGFRIAKSAVAVLPACALLDPQQSRNDVTRLAECAMLAGDRAAAAEAMNVFRTPRFTPSRGDFARALASLFDGRAEVQWPDRAKVSGFEAAAAEWATQAVDDPFVPEKVFGETADRVRMDGTVHLKADGQGAPGRQVSATLVMTRESGYGFRIRSLTSGSPSAR